MAAARQKEMKVSITELATTIRTRLEDPGGMACEPADIRKDSSQRWFARSCLPNDESTLAVRERQRRPRTVLLHSLGASNPRPSLDDGHSLRRSSGLNIPVALAVV